MAMLSKLPIYPVLTTNVFPCIRHSCGGLPIFSKDFY